MWLKGRLQPTTNCVGVSIPFVCSDSSQGLPAYDVEDFPALAKDKEGIPSFAVVLDSQNLDSQPRHLLSHLSFLGSVALLGEVKESRGKRPAQP